MPALFQAVGWDIQKALATAVPIRTFKAQYAGEGLTVPKCGNRAVWLSRVD